MSKPAFKHVAVIDIGKTNAKMVVVDAMSGREIAVRKTANTVLTGPPYPHFDIDGLWSFIIASLRDFVTHGASGVH
jgi:sugar (pentulose or hexulose) kinase